MKFRDKYASMSDKEQGKKIVSDDIYALCEMIDNLNEELSKLGARLK